MRRSYVWDPKQKKLVPKEIVRSDFPFVFGDTPEFKAPGSDLIISGRKAKREFMKRNNLEEVGNDQKGLEEHTARQRMYRDERETKQLKATLTEVLRAREFFRGR